MEGFHTHHPHHVKGTMSEFVFIPFLTVFLHMNEQKLQGNAISQVLLL